MKYVVFFLMLYTKFWSTFYEDYAVRAVYMKVIYYLYRGVHYA